ncbi:MAG: sulfate/molybdate ABC transporter ATP-binding protein [Eubacteriaceae bacterium]|nr:sulfate/molybdate ABC transporter ATP-binding protein [Eubacteriaceae bacterium]
MKLSVDIRKKLNGFDYHVKFETNTNALGILGSSGSGKSMTLRFIAGLEIPDSGRIVLNDRVLFDSVKKINLPVGKRKIGLLFQNYALFPNMTVEENIGFGINSSMKEEKSRKTAELIKIFHLHSLGNRYPSQLSGGQQQRVALARALATEPEILMLDEPFSALDEHLRKNMLEQLLESLKDYNGQIIFVTHNMEEAYRASDSFVLLDKGKVDAIGNKEQIFSSPPTLNAARLAGYRNISSVEYVGEQEFRAHDWGISLRTEKKEGSDQGHLILRSNDISETSDTAGENVFKCHPEFVRESPFSITVYLSFDGHDENRELMEWELPKDRWAKIKKTSSPLYIKIHKEKLGYIGS